MKAFFLHIFKLAKFRVFNKRTLVVEEFMHIIFDEGNPFKRNDDDDIEILKDGLDNASSSLPLEPPKEEFPLLLKPPKVDGISHLPMEWEMVINHLIDQILGDLSQGVATRSSLKQICNNLSFLS